MPQDQRRNHFRVEYPLSQRPDVRINGQVFKVVDLSESGLRFELEGKMRLSYGESVKGAINFSDGMSCLIFGKVLRIDGDHVILMLSQGVPLSRMLLEERTVVRKFGKKAG